MPGGLELSCLAAFAVTSDLTWNVTNAMATSIGSLDSAAFRALHVQPVPASPFIPPDGTGLGHVLTVPYTLSDCWRKVSSLATAGSIKA